MRTLTQDECITFLETARWNGKPCCPYCNSTKFTAYKQERRYRCNECFTSYSVTVGTLFHKTHVNLETWFRAIHLIVDNPDGMSVRKLAKELNVNKNTVLLMRSRIDKAMQEEPELLQKVREINFLLGKGTPKS